MPTPAREQIRLFELMALIAGWSLGLWLLVPIWRREANQPDPGRVMGAIVFSLGGLSLVGPPLLIWERRRRRTVWGAGRLMWFTQGTASWLMWPPIIYSRTRGIRSDSEVCYFYGTPLMAVYMTAALLFGGWFRKRKRRTLFRSWRERFGLGLALAWACIGLYFLSLFYYEDFRR